MANDQVSDAVEEVGDAIDSATRDMPSAVYLKVLEEILSSVQDRIDALKAENPEL